MLSLLGEYEIAIDAKGRFPLPSGFRKQMPEGEGSQFVLARGMEKCLVLYPLQTWNLQNEQLSKLNPYNPDVRKLRRLLHNGALPVDVDGAGRILINKGMQEYAEITKEITFSAQGDRIEIWDRNTYQQYLLENAGDLSALASQVTGAEYLNPFINK